ncbi:MAG TPA: hypothetical protein VKQ36_03800, partial [Ktedonobacterales bacterium]|nr:hypothetical protein [Ktedonobacterales bacterium]
GDTITDDWLATLAYGCLSPHHATQFKAFVRQVRSRYQLDAILKGDVSWPTALDERDVLYFLAQSLRARLLKELPSEAERRSQHARDLAFQAKARLKDLAAISLEIAQIVVAADDDGQELPGWFMVEVVRDLPRLIDRSVKREKTK